MVYQIQTVLLFLVLFARYDTPYSTDNQNQMSNTVNIEAKIIRFIPNAMHDNLEDGSFSIYDATEVLVISPEKLKDKKLTIYHIPPVDSFSIWRLENIKVKFKIEKLLIENDYLIFATGLQDIERITN